ncbi:MULTISPECIES: hypothetical protein [unclassified Imperialibacter]|uniref:hypothetical protein n=1 Tax=unclassified Imperialibacter TaxID=2629706 RepID=UPI0012527C36|nr:MULTISPECIES: hypothetical protein [unclassified Imperialibacter]CAD5299218.1 exported hypothetical protein [Imperialibacter sp. 89]CAD5299790.1 exported hypothetical protein [Imperialibacter sp. 75]VVT20787.1 exported hypothetical protein [Imperialibacter sp. EC-SDR9]
MRTFILSKLVVIILTTLLINQANAQNFFNYQAVIRDSDGKPMVNTSLSIQLGILKGDLTGEVIYQEVHSTSASEFGTVSLPVGNGEILSGEFSSIEWGDDLFFLKVEIRLSDDSDFVELGTTQILAVPIALYAKRSGDNVWKIGTEGISTDDKVGIGTSSPSSKLTVAGQIETTEGGLKFADGSIQTSAAMPDNLINTTEGPIYTEGANVGVGITSPTSRLSVDGVVESTEGGIKFPDGSVQTSAATVESFNGDYFNRNDGPIYASDEDYIGVGTEAPQTNFELAGDGSGNYEPVIFRNNYTMNLLAYASGDVDFLNASFVANRSRGTYGAPQNVIGGDRIGGVYGRAYLDGQYQRTAGIQMFVGVGAGAGNYPSNIRFETTSTNSVVRAERMRIADNGYVGIGTPAPGAPLTVNGTIHSTSGGIKFPDGTMQTSAATAIYSNYFNKTDGPIYASDDQIGIGTSTPQTNFEVAGLGSANYEPIIFRNNYTMNLMAHASGEIDYLNASFVSHRSRGTYESPTNVQDGDRVGGFYARYFFDGDYRRAAGIQMYVGSGAGANSYPSLIKFETTDAGEIERSERMRLTEKGFLGIGTQNPESMLSVNGTIESLEGGIKFPDGTTQSSAFNNANYFNKAGGPIYANGSNVGIGALAPQTNFEVAGVGSANYEPIIFRNNYTMNLMAHASGEIDYLNASFVSHRSRGTYQSPTNVQDGDRVGGFYARYYYDGVYRRSAGIQMYVGTGTGVNSYPSFIAFETTNVGEIERSERMRISEVGNIGVGTSAPKSKIHVTNGDVYIDNTSNGVIMKSPDGTCWRMTVDNAGAPVFTTIVCPENE